MSQAQEVNSNYESSNLVIPLNPEDLIEKDYIVQESEEKDHFVIIPKKDPDRKSIVVPIPEELLLD